MAPFPCGARRAEAVKLATCFTGTAQSQSRDFYVNLKLKTKLGFHRAYFAVGINGVLSGLKPCLFSVSGLLRSLGVLYPEDL